MIQYVFFEIVEVMVARRIGVFRGGAVFHADDIYQYLRKVRLYFIDETVFFSHEFRKELFYVSVNEIVGIVERVKQITLVGYAVYILSFKVQIIHGKTVICEGHGLFLRILHVHLFGIYHEHVVRFYRNNPVFAFEITLPVFKIEDLKVRVHVPVRFALDAVLDL